MEQKCKHENKHGEYGHLSTLGFKGVGIYTTCLKCNKIIGWQDDFEANTIWELESNMENQKRLWPERFANKIDIVGI